MKNLFKYSKLIYFGAGRGAPGENPPAEPRRFNGMAGLIQHVEKRLRPGQNLRTAVEKYFLTYVVGRHPDFSPHLRKEDIRDRGISIGDFIRFAYNARSTYLRSLVACYTKSKEILHRYVFNDRSPEVQAAVVYNPYAFSYMLTKLADLRISGQNTEISALYLARHKNITRRDLFRLLKKFSRVSRRVSSVVFEHRKITLRDVEKYVAPSNSKIIRIGAFESGKVRVATYLRYINDPDANIRRAIINGAPASVLYKMFGAETDSYLAYLILRSKNVNIQKIPVKQLERAVELNNACWQLLHTLRDFAEIGKIPKRIGITAKAILNGELINF